MRYTFPNKVRNAFIQLDLHEGIFLVGTVGISGFALHFGFDFNLNRVYPFGQDKRNQGKILADNENVVSRGHSVCFIAPHLNILNRLPIPPGAPNLLLPFLILNSSNECLNAASSVKGPDGDIAVSTGVVVGINWACNTVRLPTSLVFNSGTVIIGFTTLDFVKTLALGSFYVVSDIFFEQLFGLLGKWFTCYGKWSLKSIPGMLKNRIIKILRFLDLPRNYYKKGRRGADSMSEEIIEQIFGLFGERAQDYWENTPHFDGKAVDTILEWIDNNSETLPAEN